VLLVREDLTDARALGFAMIETSTRYMGVRIE
jgi:hypothetical protein